MAGRTSYYGGIVLDGLVFHIDAAKQESYAKRGLRYMQAGNNNLFIDFADTSISPSTKNATGTIINGATFSNFCPYHLTGYQSQFWHDPSGSAWRQSAGVGTFYGNIEFDGVDDYVSFSATPDINTTDITVSAWFYVNKFTSVGTASIVSRYNNTSLNNGWELGYNNNGVVWFNGRENSGTYISVTASLLVKQTNMMAVVGTANGGWYNAVGTKSGNQWSISVAETNCFRHVDNIAEVRKADLKHLPSPRMVQLGTGTVPFDTNSLVLGKASDFNKYYMNGRLMNVSIYNRALSLAEINQNFDSFSKRIIDIEGIPTPLSPFDYMIVTYLYDPTPPGRDLDSATHFSNTGTAEDNKIIGCGQNSVYRTPNPSTSTINTAYLYQPGDDNLNGFGESILINFKNLELANISQNNDVSVELYAGWCNPPLTGPVANVSVTTYIGGTLTEVNQVILSSGTVVNQFIKEAIPIVDTGNNSCCNGSEGYGNTTVAGMHSNKTQIGRINYNLVTKVASVTFI